MDLLLVITDTKRKSLVFISRTLKTFSLSEMVEAIKNSVFERVYIVTGASGTYMRSAPDKTEKNNIDSLSITGTQLALIAQGQAKSTPAVAWYLEEYLKSLSEGGPFIEPIDSFKIPRAVVQRVFQAHAPIIAQAAKEFDIDCYTLGAILIDEIARLYPFEPIFEKVSSGIVGRRTTVGVAQVSFETANDMIKKGLYNPNPQDKKLPFTGNLKNVDRVHLYRYMVEPKHSIRFAAAYIRSVITYWSKYVDLSDRPEIIGTLYSKGYGEPKKNPVPNERGKQIAGEFYEYTKKWLAGI